MKSQGLTNGPNPACTNACTESAESGHDDHPGDGNNAHTRDADPGQPRDADPGGSLADALKLIGELPLTPTEKAEAVRKLLAEADG